MRKSLELFLPCIETSNGNSEQILLFFSPLFSQYFYPCKSNNLKTKVLSICLKECFQKAIYLSAWLLCDTISTITLRCFNTWIALWISNINIFFFFNLVLFYWRHQVYYTDNESTTHHILALKKYIFHDSIQLNLFSINPGFIEEKLRNLSILQSRTLAYPAVRNGLENSAVIFVMVVKHIRKMSECQANFTKLKFKYIFCTISS